MVLVVVVETVSSKKLEKANLEVSGVGLVIVISNRDSHDGLSIVVVGMDLPKMTAVKAVPHEV